MRIMVHVGHPAHVHTFKNIIWDLEKKGHEIKVIANDKEVVLDLLEAYGFDYVTIGRNYKNLIGKAYGLVLYDFRSFKVARKFKPDLFLSRGAPCAAHTSRLLRKPHIAFCDTEKSKLNDMLAYPFTDVICTPACFKRDFGKKHVRVNGYKELAYLHPNHFKPDPSVLDDLGLSKKEKIIVVRFISWGAAHDINLNGIQKGSEIDIIKSLERYGRVLITSERKLDRKLERYSITSSPEKIHSLLHYAQLYIGEGGTMAIEAAVLGTPSIHIESTASGQASGEIYGNFVELRDRYNLIYFYSNHNQAMKKAIEILENKGSKKEWGNKREKLMKEKVDVASWMTDFIERYPESYLEYLRSGVS